jgi:RND family efflux transporter MFP subunit
MESIKTISRIGSFGLATLLLSGCGRRPETHPAAQPGLAAAQVQVHTAESREQATTEEVAGTVRAKLRATLEAKLSGRIDKMPVLLGQAVKAGQLVARLDAAEIKARLEQAQASLQQAERDWKRTSALFDQQAATRSEYDAAESRHGVAKAAVAEAQAMMSYVEVLAPFDGVVTKKWVDVGDLASPGKPLIDIEDPSLLQLEAGVPEAIASRIQQDARLGIRVDAMKGELEGTVREIAPTADPASRTFRVKLDLPRTAGLMSGQFARLVVPIGQSSSVRVPVAAVILRGQLEILFVVANQRAQLRLVKTGRRIGDEVEILAGLEVGESVVVGGAALLADGQPVEAR